MRIEEPLGQDGPLADVVIKIAACHVEKLNAKGRQIPAAIRTMGLIDSGSTGTGVHIGFLKQLGIAPTDAAAIISPTTRGKRIRVNRYRICLSLMLRPSHHSFDPLLVTEMDLSLCPFKVVIGRDVLKSGVFIMNGKESLYSLEF